MTSIRCTVINFARNITQNKIIKPMISQYAVLNQAKFFHPSFLKTRAQCMVSFQKGNPVGFFLKSSENRFRRNVWVGKVDSTMTACLTYKKNHIIILTLLCLPYILMMACFIFFLGHRMLRDIPCQGYWFEAVWHIANTCILRLLGISSYNRNPSYS